MLLLLAVPLLGFKEIPTLDGPAHVQTAVVLQGLLSGAGGVWADVFRLELRPWPNWMIQAMLVGLQPVLGWAGAEKAVLLGCFLALPLAFRYLLVKLGCRSAWAGMLVFPLAHHHLLYLGFWNYTYGLAWALAGAGWVARAELKGGQPWGVALLGLALYFCHPLAWGLGGLLVTGVWWLQSQPGGWGRWVAAWAPSGLLVLWFLNAAPRGEAVVWMPPGELLIQGLRMDVAEPFRRSTPLAALFAGMLALASAGVGWRYCQDCMARRAAVFFAGAASVAIVLCLVLPDAASGGSLVQYRLTLVPWLLVLAGAAFVLAESSTGLKLGVAAACLAAAAAGVFSLAGVLSAHQAPAARVGALLDLVPEQAVIEVRFAQGFRESGPWRIYVWEHAAARAAARRQTAWPAAYQFTATGFPVRVQNAEKPGSPEAVVDWGGVASPQGFRKAAELEQPRVVLWLRE